MIDIVYLDMDGVLANFHKGVYDIFKQPYKYNTSLSTWNFWENWEEETTRDDVNNKCDTNFWATLDWMHDGYDIYKEIVKYFKAEQIYILTNPVVGGAGTATGKMLWVEKHLPGFIKRTIITQASKSLLAKSNTLLVDDNDSYTKEFIAAGGDAILVPRPWNKLHKDKDCAWFTVATELVKRMDGCKLID